MGCRTEGACAGGRGRRLALLALALALACGDRPRELPGKGPEAVAGGAPTPSGPAGELRVAVAAMTGPVATLEDYGPLLDRLAGALGRTPRLIQRRTYREVNDLLLAGGLDLAFVCSGTYAALPQDAPVELLAVPVAGDGAVYHSVIVVREGSPYRAFDDLRGTRFAFSDELSNTGYLYPRTLLEARGETPASFFSASFFTGGHDRSILAVYRQLADAAAVHERVYRAIVVPGSPYWQRLRVLERSAAYPSPPVVAPLSVPSEVRDRLRRELLEMDRTAEGRALLARLGILAFAPGDPAGYRSIRETAARLGVP